MLWPYRAAAGAVLMQSRSSLPGWIDGLHHACGRTQPRGCLPHGGAAGKARVLQILALTKEGMLMALGCFVKPELLQ